jgi:hypothetical protein
MAYFSLYSRGGTEEHYENLCPDQRCPDRFSNRTPSDYKQEILLLVPQNTKKSLKIS